MKTSMIEEVPLTPGTCEWCGKNCEMEDTACGLSCEALLRRLEAVQGRIVLRALKRWRKHRGRKDTPGQGAMSEVASLTDSFLRTDRLRREEFGEQRRAARRKNEEAKAKEAAVALQSASPATNQPEEGEPT